MLTGKTKHGANRLDPKALFHAINGVMHGILTFFSPWLLPVRRTGAGDVASHLETNCSSSHLCSEGKSSVVCAFGTCFLYWFYEVGTSQLAIRDQPPPSRPFIPGE